MTTRSNLYLSGCETQKGWGGGGGEKEEEEEEEEYGREKD